MLADKDGIAAAVGNLIVADTAVEEHDSGIVHINRRFICIIAGRIIGLKQLQIIVNGYFQNRPFGIRRAA